MHLRNVSIFCDVVARRSFSKAAQANNVSQSSASQAVLMLEKRLGTELIDRSKRPLELTPAGKVYFNGCRKLLDSFREIEDKVRRLQNKVVGTLHVAAIYSIGLLQMDAYVRRFEELYPDVTLELEYAHPDEVYARVINDEADLGLVSFPRDRGETAAIPWQEQEMVAVVPPAHPLAPEQRIRPEELNGQRFVAFTPELIIQKQIERWLKRAKVSVECVLEFDNIENIKRAVEIGSGIALLPLPTVMDEVESGSLAAIHVAGANWMRPLGIVHKRQKSLTTAAAKFVELLHQDPNAFPHNGNLNTPARKSASANNGNGKRAAGNGRRASVSRSQQ